MHYKALVILVLFFTSTLYADEMERSTMTSCGYQGGTAREIQTIRQSEGDDWTQFEQKIKKIYKQGQGRTDLLVIGKKVYLEPIKTSPEIVFDHVFDACVERIQGNDASI